ncbi:unnamed protein product [Leuciscus chuanchicus]
MKEHHLQLNLAELLVLPANPSLQHDFTIQLDSSSITPSRSVKKLRVIFDDQLTFTDQITKTARSCRFALHNIRKIRPFLTEHATQLLVQALVISRLDNCNALLAGLPSCTTMGALPEGGCAPEPREGRAGGLAPVSGAEPALHFPAQEERRISFQEDLLLRVCPVPVAGLSSLDSGTLSSTMEMQAQKDLGNHCYPYRNEGQMPDTSLKTDDLRNMALNLVARLRATLNNPTPNVQGQCNAQSSSARVSRQDTSQEPQEHNAVRGPAQAPSGTAVQKNMARTHWTFLPYPSQLWSSRPCRKPGVCHARSMCLCSSSVSMLLVHCAVNYLQKTTSMCMQVSAGTGRGKSFSNANGPSSEAALKNEEIQMFCFSICFILHVLVPFLKTVPVQLKTQVNITCLAFPRCVLPFTKLSFAKHTDLASNFPHAPNFIANKSFRSFGLSTIPAHPNTFVHFINWVYLHISAHLHTFTTDICEHASNTNEGDADISEDTDEHFGSVSDILMSLEKKVDTSRSFNINVTREDLFQRGLKQWARQKQASPKNLLRVSFIGENGIDQGALRKEFLTEMVCGIEARFFEGDGERGKNPKYSICDYQDNSFKYLLSLSQKDVWGDFCHKFLTRWCYHFLCHGEMDKDVGVLKVTDQDIKNLMTEVENAEGGERLIDLSDAIVACGYTGPINVDQKKAITDAIALHALVRLIPILSQLREGLRLYGLDEVLAQHTQMCQQLFVPGHLQEVNVDFLLLALSPDFSEEGSVRRQREMRIIHFLQDFLQKLEDREEADSQEEGSPEGQSHVAAVHGTNGGGKRLSVRSFLQWVTGQAHVPLIESKREAFKITVNFDHDCDSRYGAHSLCYPIVNACAVAITFPTRHLATSQEFENNLTEAICGG